ncbi:MAG: hypothetical protein AAGJ93_10355 [Bacteroidota bacterium]
MKRKNKLKKEVKELISKDKLKKAIQLLSDHILDNEELDSLLIQQARYNRIKKQAANGTVSNDELNNEMNTLGKHILTFLRDDDWELKVVEEENVSINIDDFQTEVAMSLTRVKVGELLLKYAEESRAVSMKDIMNESKLRSRKLVNDFIKELEVYKLVNREKKEVVVWSLNKLGVKRLAKALK